MRDLMNYCEEGRANGIPLDSISEKEAKAIEPRVKTCERALFSPATSTVDPSLVMQAMKKDAIEEGVQLHCGVRYLSLHKQQVTTTDGTYDAGYVVNAAGLYADRIARDFGFAERYRILPFKGLYLYSSEPPGSIRTNIYPVPDLKNPFLGVHFTVAASGKAKIGPTAIPGLWREQYDGMANFQLNEFFEVAMRGLGLLASSNFDFKSACPERSGEIFEIEDGLAGESSGGRCQAGALSKLGKARHSCTAS